MIHLKYTFECSICGNSGEQTWGVRQGEEVPKPSLPPGWRYVLGELVCGDHQISADVYVLVHPTNSPNHKELWRQGVRF